MKTILFTAIVCCLIVAVDAQTLVTDSLRSTNKKHSTEKRIASSENQMKDMDARFFAAE